MSSIIYQSFKVTFATLYPAYASYKAVKTKNVKDYVKWMMYWVVYAFFVSVEVLADIFIVWLPFYYEMKILFMLWLLSPTAKGSSILYRKLVHPQLSRRESEIDTYIDKATEQGYSAFLALGHRILSVATNVVLSSAARGQSTITDHLRRAAAAAADTDDAAHADDEDDVIAEPNMAAADDVIVRRRRRRRGRVSIDADESANEILRQTYQREVSESRDEVDRM